MSDTSQARAHADERFLRWQHKRLHDPHIAVLNRLAERMEADPSGGGLPVPRFDPSSGGVHARALLLLQDRGPMTAQAVPAAKMVLTPRPPGGMPSVV